MRIAELLREDANMLALVLRNLVNPAQPVALHFKEKFEPVKGAQNIWIDKIMQNVGFEHFTYESFLRLKDDPAISQYVADVNQDYITLKSDNDLDTSADKAAQPAAPLDSQQSAISSNAQAGLSNDLTPSTPNLDSQIS